MPEGGSAGSRSWTNPSVLAFACDKDPLTAATDAARGLMDAARSAGMTAPPVDVVELAKLLGLELQPVNSVTDAAMTAVDGSRPDTPLGGLIPSDARLALVYNPSRPRGRLRFSIAHEIAHALFSDVAQVSRHRTSTGALPEAGDNAWELELLCNVIAAELLLPDEAVAGLLDIDTDIDFIMETRRRWDVSTEALLRRLVSSTAHRLTLVAASRRGGSSPALVVEYSIGPAEAGLPRGSLLLEPVAASAPFAVGQTSRADVDLDGQRFTVQSVGSPPYPGQTLPRVLALLERASADGSTDSRLSFVTGDITDVDAPDAPVLIAHVVSDSARAWSRRGVAASLARAYPRAATVFRSWAVAAPVNLELGHVHHVDLVGDHGRQLTIASMVAQRGYGPGVATRLQYDALRTCLDIVGSLAAARSASVHLPRIGAGQAGGRWDLIEADIVSQIIARDVPVTVHTLPNAPVRRGRG